MPDQRVKGQEVSVKVVNGGVVQSEIDSVSNFNDETALEMKEAGYLGEKINRFDNILNGFGGDFEFHVARANWLGLKVSILAKARRETPDVVFNVVVTDIFPNGESVITIYRDVTWGAIPKNVPSRGDYVKVKLSFKCSEQGETVNALP